MKPEQVLALETPPGARLYLDLLRRCLTREIFEDTGYTVTPRGHTWKSRVAGQALRLLATRRLKLVRETRVTHEDRLEGRGWPGSAEVMCGSVRLEFMQKVLYAIESENIAGDLFEGGCWRGGAVIMMLGVLEALSEKRRVVWAADSFEGYPTPTENSTEEDRYLHEQGAYFRVTREAFEQNVARYGLMSDRLKVLEGYFERTLPAAPIERLALIRIDIDGYEGVKSILENLYPKLSPGGFVLVEDYAVPGSRRAIDEYFRENRLRDEVYMIPQKKEKAMYFRRSPATSH